MSYLAIWLEGPLQSWGFDSCFGRRDTLDFPTRSGVMGLFCCALGASGEQKELLARWSEPSMKVLAYDRMKQGVAAERLPLLQDFHMVGSDYDSTDPWENLFIPKTELGKNQVGTGAKITHRHYIQDMAFGVIFEGNAILLSEMAAALQEPVWDLYLGRKSCAPTETIFRGEFDTHEEATSCLDNLAELKERTRIFTVEEGSHYGEVLTLKDVPVCFGVKKQYADRQVTVMMV